MWPKSRRCIDFAHLIGATLHRPMRARRGEGIGMNGWRSGIMACLKKHCDVPELLERVEQCIYVSRFLCQGTFATLWEAVTDSLSLAGEHDVVTVLRQQYLTTDERDGRLDAHWRGAVDCQKPGFASGSQAQEAWHRWRLKSSLPGLHCEVDDVLDCFKKFLATRADYAMQMQQQYWDSPPSGWQKDLLRGAWLKKVGRTTAEEFAERDALLCWPDGFGNDYVAMLRSHYCWNKGMNQWELKTGVRDGLNEERVQSLA